MKDESTSRVGRPSPPSMRRIAASSAFKDKDDVVDDGASDDADEAKVEEVVDGSTVGGAEANEDADAAAGST